jgi:hypothetical protein
VNFYYKAIFSKFKAWGELHCPNPSSSKTQQNHFFWMWTWCEQMGLGMEAKTRWRLKLRTSPMFMSLSFCSVNEGICIHWSNGIYKRIFPLNKMWKIRWQIITLDILGMVWQPIDLFHWSFLQTRAFHYCILWFDSMELFFCRYECGYGPEDHHKDPNHVNWTCLFGAFFHHKVLHTA